MDLETAPAHSRQSLENLLDLEQLKLLRKRLLKWMHPELLLPVDFESEEKEIRGITHYFHIELLKIEDLITRTK